ncbi:MAG: methyltransferase domain-containing protein [Verrucomicrobiota bacterium]
MKRIFDAATPELMDLPQPVSAELEQDLANLRSLNRWFGGYRIIHHFLRRWLRANSKIRLLDVATGSGDVPRLIVDYARSRNVPVEIEAIDQQEATIEIARRLSVSYPEISFSCADLFAWGADDAYDIVICSLALHHFSEEDVIRALRKFRELSSGAILVTDLQRSRFLSLAVFVVTETLYREPMTKFDGRLSAARAFSFAEMDQLAKRAGWEQFHHASFFVGRQAIWLDPAPTLFPAGEKN